MTRPRSLRLWGLALAVLWLLAIAGEWTPAAHERASPTVPRADATLSSATDAALLPARVGEEVRVAIAAGANRDGLLGALVFVLGLPALLGRTLRGWRPGNEPLRARRYTIALRAPPLGVG